MIIHKLIKNKEQFDWPQMSREERKHITEKQNSPVYWSLINTIKLAHQHFAENVHIPQVWEWTNAQQVHMIYRKSPKSLVHH